MRRNMVCIDTWGLFRAFPDKYFEEGASFLFVRTSSSAAAAAALQPFWTFLKNYPAHMIQEPSPIFILGNPNLGTSIFIQPFYPSLLSISLSVIATPDTPHLIILGTPGIGKTYFGYFLLHHLARTGATVVGKITWPLSLYTNGLVMEGVISDVSYPTVPCCFPPLFTSSQLKKNNSTTFSARKFGTRDFSR